MSSCAMIEGHQLLDGDDGVSSYSRDSKPILLAHHPLCVSPKRHSLKSPIWRTGP
jgi:hypothetical protein